MMTIAITLFIIVAPLGLLVLGCIGLAGLDKGVI